MREEPRKVLVERSNEGLGPVARQGVCAVAGLILSIAATIHAPSETSVEQASADVARRSFGFSRRFGGDRLDNDIRRRCGDGGVDDGLPARSIPGSRPQRGGQVVGPQVSFKAKAAARVRRG